MTNRAKALKLIAIITSSLVFFTLLIISTIGRFSIFPYIPLLISIISCFNLWKMYIDEKNNTAK